VSYFVGSEELEPVQGWDYQNLFGLWVANPRLSAKQVAQLVTKTYGAAYIVGGTFGPYNTTMSTYDLSHMAEFDRAVTDWVKSAKALSPEQIKSLQTYADAAFEYSKPDYRDLGQFMKAAADDESLSTLPSAAVLQAYDRFVIANAVTGTDKGTGVSIWLPSKQSFTFKKYAKDYVGLEFNQTTDWMSFLELMQ
jgi:hypothetical protein